MESSYLGKRRMNGAERETPRAPAAFLPAAAMGYEYGDAEADHLPRRVAAGEMDFFKKEKKERKDAAAAFVPSDDHGIKEDDLTINVVTPLCSRIDSNCFCVSPFHPIP